MKSISECSECGALWQDEDTCQGYFHQMLYWEAENPNFGEVHHLMVLCFHLQHPSLFSKEGLEQGKQLLNEFVEAGVSPQEIRRRDSRKVASQYRQWKIKATATNKGSYRHGLRWVMVAKDIVAAGERNYRESVQKWAKATLATLKETDNY